MSNTPNAEAFFSRLDTLAAKADTVTLSDDRRTIVVVVDDGTTFSVVTGLEDLTVKIEVHVETPEGDRAWFDTVTIDDSNRSVAHNSIAKLKSLADIERENSNKRANLAARRFFGLEF